MRRGRRVVLAAALTVVGSAAPAHAAPAAFARFAPARPLTVAAEPQAVAIGDVDGDGRVDVVAASTDPSDRSHLILSVFRQEADGTLGAATTSQIANGETALTGYPLAVADFNGDGRGDVAVPTTDGILVLSGTATGLGAPTDVAIGLGDVIAVSAADLNRDGRIDILFSSRSYGTGVLYGVAGSFAAPANVTMTTYGSVAAGDVNGDGRADVVAGFDYDLATHAESVVALTRTANGTYATAVTVALPSYVAATFLAAGDVTGDGLADVVTNGPRNEPDASVYVLAGSGTQVLAAPRRYSAHDLPGPLAVADLNGDGRQDVVDAHDGWSAVGVLSQAGDGTLTSYEPLSWIPFDDEYHSIAVGDVNGDGRLDVVVPDANGSRLAVLRQVPHLAGPTGVTNDAFADAYALTGASGSVDGWNNGATREPGEPTIAGDGQSGTTWYGWTAPEDGVVSFDTAGSSMPASLGVFTGTSLTSLTPIAENDVFTGSWYASYSRVDFVATRGTTYRIAIARSATLGAATRLNWTVSGQATSDAQEVDTPQNLLANGSFDTATTGWIASNSTISLAHDGADGSGAALVSGTPGAGHVDLVAAAPAVTNAVAGDTYAASGYLRTDDWGYDIACLVIREVTSANAIVGEASTCNTIYPLWETFVPPTYTVQRTGDSLLVVVDGTLSTAAQSYEVDGLALVRAGSATGPAVPPDTSITSGPAGTVVATTATFGFAASRANVTFECTLDLGPWTPCTSPQTYSGLGVGRHEFAVRAVDATGPDPTPATAAWQIEPATDLLTNGSFESGTGGWVGWNASTAAATDGVDGPGAAKVTGANAYFSVYPSPRPVRSTSAGTSYTAGGWGKTSVAGRRLCLYIREWSSAGAQVAQVASCITGSTSWQRFAPVSYTTQQSGGSLEVYVLETGATTGESFEADGLTLTAGATPPADTTPPETTIDSGPSGTVTDASASFVFSASEPATFQCQLDSGAWSTCTSPQSYNGLAAAQHTFAVRATDTAGNTDPTPATRTWTVAPPPPPPTTTNLLANGSFETGTTGWVGWNATLAAATDGSDGPGAAKVTGTNTYFSIYPSPRPVRATTAGTTYTATGSGKTSVAGRKLCLYIREWSSASAQVAQSSSCITASTSWQPFPAVTYTTQQSGGSLEVYILETGATSGESFEADGLALATS